MNFVDLKLRTSASPGVPVGYVSVGFTSYDKAVTNYDLIKRALSGIAPRVMADALQYTDDGTIGPELHTTYWREARTWKNRVAYVPAHVSHAARRNWRANEGATGAHAAR